MKRILTGDRPTGKLHLGHYVGSLQSRLNFQDSYEVFLLVADLHALTTKIDTRKIRQNVKDLVLDQLSVGIDPKKATFCLQSAIAEDQQLSVILSMLVTKSRLERIPTLKDMLRDLKIENPSLGLLSYPVMQAADILMLKADLVPVGKDQASHLELAREVAEKFNTTFGKVFPIPEAFIPNDIGTLVGTEGKAKMSKSLDNAIFLSDDPQSVEEKVKRMYTDPKRIHPSDPGTVEGNPIFIYLDAFGGKEDQGRIEDYKNAYKEGKVGDVEVKRFLTEVLNRFLLPIREKREKLEKEESLVSEIIDQGTKKARLEAIKTLDQAKSAIGLY